LLFFSGFGFSTVVKMSLGEWACRRVGVIESPAVVFEIEMIILILKKIK